MAHHDPAVHHDAGHSHADDEYRETPPGAGYEHTDANVWVIVKFGLWLAISAVVVHFGLAGMYWMLIEQAKDTAVQPYPLTVGQEPRLPPLPRLQQFPMNEIYDFRVNEERRLGSYGWVNKEGGVVHIPIGEAMRLTLERGLPARAEAPPQEGADAPQMTPSDSSSGRVMERRRQ